MTSSDLPKSTLFEQIGGTQRVEALVGEFYKRVFSDDYLRPFFDETSREKLEAMQMEFFSAALGGPVAFSGIDLRKAHADLEIARPHFSRFVEHLLDTLRSLNIPDHHTNQIIARISTYSGDILGDVSEDG